MRFTVQQLLQKLAGKFFNKVFELNDQVLVGGFATKMERSSAMNDTVGGKNPAMMSRLVVYPIIDKLLYIPGG